MLLHHVNVGEFVGWGGVFFFSGRDAPRVTNSGLLADVCGGGCHTTSENSFLL
jgi:hypothetical protein